MAGSVNKAILIGNVTKDVELKKLDSGNSVVAFSIATNRQWKDQNGDKKEQPEFHNIVAWGKLAEICAQYLKKGLKVYIEGRLQTREWEAQDGSKRRQTEIVATEMHMLSRKDGNTTRHEDMGGIETVDGPSEDIKLDDVPF